MQCISDNITIWYVLMVKFFFPRIWLIFFWVFGIGKLFIKTKLSFTGLIELFWITWPRYFSESAANVDFVNFNLKPSVCITFNNNCVKWLIWSLKFLENIRISSIRLTANSVSLLFSQHCTYDSLKNCWWWF